MDLAEGCFVIDTSSILAVREDVPRAERVRVFAELESLVFSGELVFPKQVMDEMDRFKSRKNPDKPHDWAKGCAPVATRYGNCYEELREVLAHPQVSRVVDPNKVTGVEEADPYLLALALHLKFLHGRDIIVVNEETKDRPDKVSLHQACARLRVFPMRLRTFLDDRGILAVEPR